MKLSNQEIGMFGAEGSDRSIVGESFWNKSLKAMCEGVEYHAKKFVFL